MRSLLVLSMLLVMGGCRRDSVSEKSDRLLLVTQPLNSWWDWEHSDFWQHVDCAGTFRNTRVATKIVFASVGKEFIACAEDADRDTLLLIDAHSCGVTRALTDARLGVNFVTWNDSGTLGFLPLFETDDQPVDTEKRSSGLIIIHGTHPPTLEHIDGAGWLPVGLPYQKPSSWSPSGQTIFLHRYTGAERVTEHATWNAAHGLQLLRDVDLGGVALPTFGWKGETPLIETREGMVELSPK